MDTSKAFEELPLSSRGLTNGQPSVSVGLLIPSSTLDPMDNATSSEEEKELMAWISRLNTAAYVYLMPIFIGTGIFTNLVNIYVLHDLGKEKDKRNRGSATTYMYLNWLSVAQLLACISVIPSLINLYRDALSFSWAVYYAHFEIFLMNCLTSTCVYVVVGLSLDRFVAVCKPHSYQTLNRARLALIRIVASFVFPPIIYTPLCFFQKVEKNKDESGFIPVDNKAVTEKLFWQFWNIAVELCHRLFPAIIIVILNSCIIFKFKRMRNSSARSSKKETRGERNSKETSRPPLLKSASKTASPENESRMFILLMGVIVVFLLCTLPAAYLGLTDTFGYMYISFGFEVFRAVANLLEVLGFSLNFFLYFFLVPEVRAKLETTFSCHRKP